MKIIQKKVLMNNIQNVRHVINKNFFLAAFTFLLIIIGLGALVFNKYQQDKHKLINDQIHSSFILYQTSLSEKLSLLANTPIFINYLKSGEISRDKLYVKFFSNILKLHDPAVTGIKIEYKVDPLLAAIQPKKPSTIFSYGKESSSLVRLKLCYLNNNIDGVSDNIDGILGICNHVLTLYFSTNNLLSDLIKINPGIMQCAKNCYFLNLENQTMFGSFPLENDSNLSLNVALAQPDNIYIYISLAVSLLLMVILIAFIRYKIRVVVDDAFSKPLHTISNSLKKGCLPSSEKYIDELRYLCGYIEKYYVEKDNIERVKIAQQVAHDIRSPLTALNTVLKNLPQIPEKQRITLRNAATRINDIANNLLAQYRSENNTHDVKNTLRTWLIAPVIENIMTEKRVQFENSQIELEMLIEPKAYFSFSKIDLNEIERVLSNLINNAAEAFLDAVGIIVISLETDKENIYIKVVDNGCGIPTEKLATIFEAKKTTKKSGSGIGLFHAKSVIDKFNGKIAIESQRENGTRVMITLPQAKIPIWFASKITIESNCQIVVLDDDESVHGAWDTRLKELLSDANILHFRKGNDFIDWYALNKNRLILVLSDYELLGELKTGLDILEELKIGNRGILITSHYEKTDIIERCTIANIRILPKSLVTYIPIVLEATPLDLSHPQTPYEPSLKTDYILIDDDELITDMWAMQAEIHNKNLIVFNSSMAAEKDIFRYDRAAIVYLDSNLGNGVKGEDYAKSLYEAGFKNIYLATAHNASQFSPMYWIKAIVGKDVPF
jgi:signal transduction histidine kinase